VNPDIKLGDSLVAATALIYELTLVTRNVDDFVGIEGLRVLNPFADRPSQI
jgi:predicted nucleic acid-binding protein